MHTTPKTKTQKKGDKKGHEKKRHECKQTGTRRGQQLADEKRKNSRVKVYRLLISYKKKRERESVRVGHKVTTCWLLQEKRPGSMQPNKIQTKHASEEKPLKEGSLRCDKDVLKSPQKQVPRDMPRSVTMQNAVSRLQP